MTKNAEEMLNAFGLTRAQYDDLRVVVAAAEALQAAPPNILDAVASIRSHFGMDYTYTCEFCNETTPACLWGPGWVTCPHCQKVARTHRERHGDALSTMQDQ